MPADKPALAARDISSFRAAYATRDEDAAARRRHMSRRPSSNSTARELKDAIFRPVLHFVRWSAAERDQLIDDIAATGTALTLGIHSRIDATVAHIVAWLPHGNVYVNRNMIGAVVGSQPFGGSGLASRNLCSRTKAIL